MLENRMINLLPRNIRRMLEKEIIDVRELQEIRLRAGKPLMFIYNGEEIIPKAEKGKGYIVAKEEIDEMVEYVSNYSL